ncbi:hypothetical protein EMCRGX_G026232 [Ephydatia muelleri]
MAEYEGMDEATLQQKLEAATSYDERSAIRQALRQLKKERGEQIGSARKGQSGYSRFVATKPVGKSSAKNYVHLDDKLDNTATASPMSPPLQTAAKRRDPVGVRASASPTPQALGMESPAAKKDGCSAVRPSDPRSPPPRGLDEETARVQAARIISPPPPLSPAHRKTSDKEELEDERKSAQDETCEERGESVEEMKEHVAESDGKKEGSVEKELEGKELKEEEEVKVEEEKDEGGVEETEKGEEEEGHSKSENEAKITIEEPDIAASIQASKPLSQKESPRLQEAPALQGVKLHKMPEASKNSRDERKDTPKDAKFDFGVKLKRPKSPPLPERKATPSTTESIPSWREKKSSGVEEGVRGGDSSPRLRAHTVAARPQKDTPPSASGGPRTLRDFMELTAKAKKVEDKPTTPLENTQLYTYLNAYVAKELSLPPGSGASLYEVCSSSTNLCKLINKSVPNTVDLRALTQISSTASKHVREEAEQDNMTLVTESARAIGCHISDATGEKVLRKDPETIRNLLVDLIRARVVNMPGMDEEPASVFQDMRALFEKLGVKVGDESSPVGDAVDAGIGVPRGDEQDKKNSSSSKDSWRDRHLREEKEEEAPSSQQPKTWREPRAGSGDEPKRHDQDESLSYEERAARRKAARAQESEPERKEKLPDNGAEKSSLTEKAPEAASYEERAALRRAERDRRMKEREALATAK